MSDTDKLLKELTSGTSTPQQKGLALKALRSEEAPTSWLPDEAMTGATVGGTLGMMMLPLSKPIRRLSEKALFKDLAAHRVKHPGEFMGYKTMEDAMAAVPHGSGRDAIKELKKSLKPTTLEGMNTANMSILATLGAVGGSVAGGSTGYAVAPKAPNFLESGKLDEPSFKAMLKVLNSTDASQEDRDAALLALKAQGTKTRIGMSDLGQALALGSLGTLIGGYAGQKIGRRMGMQSIKNSEVGATTDALLGSGARNMRSNRTRVGSHLGEGIGDVIGGAIGGVIPFTHSGRTPENYTAALDTVAHSKDPVARGIASQRLTDGFEKTTGVPSWGEFLGGGLGATAGTLAGYVLRAKGGKGIAHNLGQGLMPVGRKGLLKSLDLGLGGGYGAAAGTALGTAAGANYEDPFKDATRGV